MSLAEWIALITAVVTILATVIGVIYKFWELKQKERESKENTSHEARMGIWLKNLKEPAKLASGKGVDVGFPYQAGHPIRNPEFFYGFREQIGGVIQCVNGSQMASVSILGAHKSGKTSFFHHLRHIFNSDHFPQVVPVFLDAQSAISGDRNFYAYMLREAQTALYTRRKASGPPPEVPTEVDFEILATFLEQASKKQSRFVFLLDEFEGLLQEKKISGGDFFGSLRALILRGNVSWVIASCRKLRMPETLTSPFPNIIQDTFWMGALSHDDARLLVSEPAARAGNPFEHEDIDLILDVAGRMPFMLQKASLLLYKAHRSGTVGESARTHLANAFKLDSTTHFESQLSILSPKERDALFLLSLQKDVGNYSSILNSLEDYGFVEKTTEGFQILGKAFEEYLYQQAKEASIAVVTSTA
jgi:hypothetical protein